MDIKWKTLTANALLYGAACTILHAIVFVLLGLSGNLLNDAVFGAFVGALTGLLVSLSVGLIEHVLRRAKGALNSTAYTLFNTAVGTFSGILAVVAVIFVMVPLTGYMSRPPDLIVWAVILARLIGTPLGVVTGAFIGATWHWLAYRLSFNGMSRPAHS